MCVTPTVISFWHHHVGHTIYKIICYNFFCILRNLRIETLNTCHCLATSHIIEFLEAFEALLDKKAMVINSNSCAHWHVRGDDHSAVVGRFFQA